MRDQFAKMSKGQVLAHYEIEVLTSAIYKEALWQLHMQDPTSVHYSKKRAHSTLTQSNIMEPLNTSLDGFRNFSVDPEWDADLTANRKTQIKNELD